MMEIIVMGLVVVVMVSVLVGGEIGK